MGQNLSNLAIGSHDGAAYQRDCFLPFIREFKGNWMGSLVRLGTLAQLGKCGSMCLKCRCLGSLSKAPIWKYTITDVVLQDSCSFELRNRTRSANKW